MQSNIKTLSIILPCFNPANGWEKNIVNCYTKISQELIGVSLSLIVVNDGSSKKIKEEEIEFLNQNIADFTFIHNEQNKGKGFAVKTGAALCKSEVAIYTDIDFPYKEEDLINMYYQIVRNNSDLIIGVRNQKYYDDIPLLRKKISQWYKNLIKRFLQIPTTDTQAGLKAISPKAIKELLACQTDGYLFDLELIKRCAKSKLHIEQCQITLKPNIIMRKMPMLVLAKEFNNFIKIALTNY